MTINQNILYNDANTVISNLSCLLPCLLMKMHL